MLQLSVVDEIHNQNNLEEFFVQRIQESLAIHGLSVSEQVEYYLVQLLKKFSLAENFFHTNEKGVLENRPLALMLYDATFCPASQKFLHLKKMGDSALYQAGVFYDGLVNQVVDVKYYIVMGQKAYASLAHQKTITDKSMTDLFVELCDGFPQLVEVMALCCESDSSKNQNLLRWIERYHKTKSPQVKEILKQRGIIVDQLIQDKEVQ